MAYEQLSVNRLPGWKIIPDIDISSGAALDKSNESSVSRGRFGSSSATCLQNTACA